jgi:hypothetical protein
MAILAGRPTFNMKVISFNAVPVGGGKYKGEITVDFGDGKNLVYEGFEASGVPGPVKPWRHQ